VLHHGFDHNVADCVDSWMCTGTPYNRMAFLVKFQQVMTLCETMGGLCIFDIQSILHMLCPTFPLSVIKNAFTPAVAWEGVPQHMQLSRNHPAKLSPPRQCVIHRRQSYIQAKKGIVYSPGYCSKSDI
jgi:hypothetical protein